MADALTGAEIAIVGLAGRFPGARDLDEYWRNLCDGVESIVSYSAEELIAQGAEPALLRQPGFVKVAAQLENVAGFDAAFFGYTPREAELMDPQQRLFLECAWEALETAGHAGPRGELLVGVFGGAALSTYLLMNLASNPELVRSQDPLQLNIGNAGSFMVTRVAYKLDLKGPSFFVESACSTSLVAVHVACQSLLNQECDLALAGGVSVNLSQQYGYRYVEGGILSPDGHCRPFDAQGRGIVFGSGAGVVVLRRLKDALAEGDHVYAVIKGSAVNNDGAFRAGYTAPGVDGQAEVISEALGAAGVPPETIAYVETHGTGTPLGDPIEVQALTKVFGDRPQRSCALGSVKANIGHLDAAAGAAGLIKTALALEHRKLPPSINFETPNPNISWDTGPFYVHTDLAEWKSSGPPRRAGVSSFGMGGTNAHVILEEAAPTRGAAPSRPLQLLLLSARSATALDAMTSRLAAHLRQRPERELADAAYTLQVGRKRFSHRRALVCTGTADAIEGLGNSARLLAGADERTDRPVAFMFPGQGTQYARMAAGLYEGEPIFREQLDACAGLLLPHLDRDLLEVLYPKPERVEEAQRLLQQTRWAQPALFAVEYALARLWMSWGLEPAAMIGHSIGEYVAACLAGVMTLQNALALVAARGSLIQGLPGGSMLSVALSEAELRPYLEEPVSLAAVNGPAFCVAAGPTPAVEALQSRLSAKGHHCRVLKTSHAFHSTMMDPILDRFIERVRRIPLKAPQLPYVSNVTGTWITPAEATDPRYWAAHLRQPVRFAAGLEALLHQGDRVLLEVGPGRSLSTFAGQLPASKEGRIALASLRHPDDAQPDQPFLLAALGRLWMAGVDVDWTAFHRGERRLRTPLPTYPFERRRYWIAPPDRAGGPRADSAQFEPGEGAHLPAWRRTPPLAPPPPDERTTSPRSWLLIGDDGGVGELLARRLRELGHAVAVARPGGQPGRDADGAYRFRPRESADYAALLSGLEAAGAGPDTLVYFGSPTSSERGEDSAAICLLRLAQAASRLEGRKAPRLEVVSRALRNVEGNGEATSHGAALLGAFEVAAQELPRWTCGSIDLSGAGDASGLVEPLLAELSAAWEEPVVALRDGRRWLRTFTSARLAPDVRARPWREGGTYLFVDGTGHAGPLAALLARAVKARFVHVVPSSGAGPPNPPESPAGVVTVVADLASAAGLRAGVDDLLRRHGALHGAIYLPHPGARAFEALSESNLPDLATWLDGEERAVESFEAALEGRTLDFCLLCSSAAPTLGNWGRAARALAGAALDARVARRLRRGGTPWISLDWEASPMRGAEGLATAHAEAAEAVRRVVASGLDGPVVLSPRDPAERLRRPRGGDAAGGTEQTAPDAASALHPRPHLEHAYVEPRTEEEKQIAGIWQQVLGIEPIGLHDSFFELGGHSLLATAVVGRLREVFGVTVPLQSLFEAPTVGAMAALLAGLRIGGGQGDPEKEALLRMLAELSAEEVPAHG